MSEHVTDNRQLIAAARTAWACLETIHIVGYFAEEPTEQYVALGLHPQLSYFPARSAALGAVRPEVSEATFYVFAPWLHEAALPAAWDVVTPERLVQARRDGVGAALSRILGSPDLAEALDLARAVTEGLTCPGRPLYAAHAGLAWPGTDLLDLWHAATLVREHRGDGHVAVLTAAGVGPAEATVLDGIWSQRTRFLEQTRGWSAEELTAATGQLAARGWVDGEGALTEAGRAARLEMESSTDDAGLEGWTHLGMAGALRLAELLTPLRDTILSAGLLPEELVAASGRTSRE